MTGQDVCMTVNAIKQLTKYSLWLGNDTAIFYNLPLSAGVIPWPMLKKEKVWQRERI